MLGSRVKKQKKKKKKKSRVRGVLDVALRVHLERDGLRGARVVLAHVQRELFRVGTRAFRYLI